MSAYLKRRTKAQLLEIAQASGAMDTLESTPHTKAELVTALSTYFAGNTDASRDWLPGVMQFPAIEQECANADSLAEIDATAA